MTVPHTARQQLADAMNRRRAALGINWQEVARRGGVSVPTLRRARNGNDPLSIDTIAAIERALNWEEGHVEAILNGASTTTKSAPIPPTPPGIDPKRWKSWDETGRQAVLDALRIAERRSTRNHPIEGAHKDSA